MKCLYTANYNLYNAVMEIQELKQRYEQEIDVEKKNDIVLKTDGGGKNGKKETS